MREPYYNGGSGGFSGGFFTEIVGSGGFIPAYRGPAISMKIEFANGTPPYFFCMQDTVNQSIINPLNIMLIIRQPGSLQKRLMRVRV